MPALTPSQQRAVLFNEADSAILAGAGSGKTFVIVEKVAALTEKLHVPPEKILVVTFTEKAAEEVKERIGKRLAVQGVVVSTIHAFAADVLRRHGGGLGVASDFRILTDFLSNLEQARSVREKAIERISENDPEILEAVSRFGFRKTLGFFLDLMSEPAHRRAGAPFPNALRALEGHYESRKKSLNALDFDDLEKRLLSLARNHPQALKGAFSWIIVDEFQDTSPVQWDILETLRAVCPARIVIVGDPRQSIYRFRGADPTLFLKVADRMKDNGGRILELEENFRSCREIVTFVNAVGERLFADPFPPMRAIRADAGVVERLPLPDDGSLGDFRAAEARAVATRFSALRGEGHLWKSMAVLFKTRKAVADYETAFREAGIPYRTSLGEPLLERPEILTLLFWMQRKAGGPDKKSLYLDTAISHSPLRDFNEDFAADPLPEYLDRLFEAATPCFAEDLFRNLKAFRTLLNDLMSLGVGHLKALVEGLVELREDGARIQCPDAVASHQDAVTIMTVHGAKGLEWPIVALGDLKAAAVRPPSLYVASEDGDLLLKEGDREASGLKTKLVKNEAFQEREGLERQEGLEESKRLLYVALTRARDRLILPLPLPKAGKKESAKPSGRWSDWLST